MTEVVTWAVYIGAGGAGLFIVDRMLLKLEANGYIYYRKKKANLVSAGSALVEVHRVLEPSARYVVEARQEVHEVEDDDGAPPHPAKDGPLVVDLQAPATRVSAGALGGEQPATGERAKGVKG